MTADIGPTSADHTTVRNLISRRLRGFSPILVCDSSLRAATVVVVVDRVSSEYGVWLTRRGARMREHPGQYVLPGGRVESGEDTVTAGLRELKEELGIDLRPSDVLGRLDDYVTRSGYLICPIVCWAREGQIIHPNIDEVASVHFASFADLLTTPRFVSIPQTTRPLIEFPLLGVIIHAPTGALLYQFAEVALRGRRTLVAEFDEPLVSWPAP
jgi:8-oxo-dGTP pyrophosphatase MutT (NUDIX family)